MDRNHCCLPPAQCAAQQLHEAIKQWKDNAIVRAARRMANHMVKMDQCARYCRSIKNSLVLIVFTMTRIKNCFSCRDALDAGKESSKDDLNDSIYLIIRESEEVETIATKVASACTEEGLKEVNGFATLSH